MSATVRILVVAEGPSEIGKLDQLANPVGRKRGKVVEGFVPPLLRKMLGGKVEIKAQRVTQIGKFERKPRLPGHGDRAAKALALAVSQDFDLLVFVKDVDKQGGKRAQKTERKKKLKEMHAEIDAGFGAVTDADHVERVKATPCRMLEAWALGDPNAVRNAVNKTTASADCPASPEALWGDERDASSNHPKCVLRRVLGDYPSAEQFEQIATSAKITTLRTICPESFEPFALEMERAQTLFTPERARR